MSVGTVDDVAWQRLDVRVVWVDLVVLVLSLIPTVLTTFVFGLGVDVFGTWAAGITTLLGAGGAIADLVRWLHTKYRITDARVEKRSGAFVRTYRFVPRERIRSIDSTATVRYRIAGLRVVAVGSGEAEPTFFLDAVSTLKAQALRRELLGDRQGGSAASDLQGEPEPDPDGITEGTVLARLRWSWMPYNLINAWAFLVAAFGLWSLFWAFQLININLWNVLGRLIDWDRVGLFWSIVIGVGGTFAIGVLLLAVGFVRENWGFELARISTEKGSALRTRQGLLQTREVHRDEDRIRGMHLSEPLFWRWMGLAETEVISTGLAGWSVAAEPASLILPRGPVSEARRVASLVLMDGLRPLETPLPRHPRTALLRRLVWAVTVPIAVTGLLLWFEATGAVPRWSSMIALALFPVAPVLAVIAYRALGHALVGHYLILRCGLLSRSTAALEVGAVIGWTLRQSIIQRWLGLITVRVSTAAGHRSYQAPDIDEGRALGFIAAATPGMVAEFLDDPDARGREEAPGETMQMLSTVSVAGED